MNSSISSTQSYNDLNIQESLSDSNNNSTDIETSQSFSSMPTHLTENNNFGSQNFDQIMNDSQPTIVGTNII